VIEIEQLHKAYGERVILSDITLHIGCGEMVILQGISGSGKTTLLSLIAGLEKPSSGAILIDGEPIHKLPDRFASELRAAKIGMVFQHFNLMEHLSVAQNVMVPLIPYEPQIDRVQERVSSAMERANIVHRKDQLASRLSGGEKQRTAIARALVANPDILLCDEPTANLDHANALKFIEMMESLHQEGKTIVIATHDPRFNQLKVRHRTIPMVEGKLLHG